MFVIMLRVDFNYFMRYLMGSKRIGKPEYWTAFEDFHTMYDFMGQGLDEYMRCKNIDGDAVHFIRYLGTVDFMGHSVEGSGLMLMASTIDLRDAALSQQNVYICRDSEGNIPNVLMNSNTYAYIENLYLDEGISVEEFFSTGFKGTVGHVYKFSEVEELGIHAHLTGGEQGNYGIHYPYDDAVMEDGVPIKGFTGEDFAQEVPVPAFWHSEDEEQNAPQQPEDRSDEDFFWCC